MGEEKEALNFTEPSSDVICKRGGTLIPPCKPCQARCVPHCRVLLSGLGLPYLLLVSVRSRGEEDFFVKKYSYILVERYSGSTLYNSSNLRSLAVPVRQSQVMLFRLQTQPTTPCRLCREWRTLLPRAPNSRRRTRRGSRNSGARRYSCCSLAHGAHLVCAKCGCCAFGFVLSVC